MSVIGVEWNVLSKVETTPLTYDVPVWVTEHKCGNYPFISGLQPATATTPAIEGYVEPAPNNQSYAVESWWYIRDAITKAKVTAYNVPHLVLDPMGLGNDTSRSWSLQRRREERLHGRHRREKAPICDPVRRLGNGQIRALVGRLGSGQFGPLWRFGPSRNSTRGLGVAVSGPARFLRRDRTRTP